jgi:NADH pyrophosphatase NudC (nudix superfamily)
MRGLVLRRGCMQLQGGPAVARYCWRTRAPPQIRAQSTDAGASAATSTGQPPKQQQQQPPSSAAPPSAHNNPIFYSAYPLDRAAAARHDPEQLSRLLAHPAARLLPVSGAKALVVAPSTPPPSSAAAPTGGPELSLAWLTPASDALPSLDPEIPPLFLGLDSAGAPHFGGQVAKPAADALAAAVPGARWAVARTAGPALGPGDAALVATACGLAQWHQASLFGGATGEATQGAEGGFARRVPSTGRCVYPRIDPAIITLVTAGDWALLGRKAEWPAARCVLEGEGSLRLSVVSRAVFTDVEGHLTSVHSY